MPSLASTLAYLSPAPLRNAASSAATHAAAAAVAATDSEWMPDAVLRAGIKALLKQRDGEVSSLHLNAQRMQRTSRLILERERERERERESKRKGRASSTGFSDQFASLPFFSTRLSLNASFLPLKT